MAPRRAGIDPDMLTPNSLTRSEPASQQDSLSAQQADILVSQEAGATAKVTYYLKPETVARLDLARVKLITLATAGRGPEQTRGVRRRLNLSAIVDAALTAALEDLDAKQSDSHLAVTLVKR